MSYNRIILAPVGFWLLSKTYDKIKKIRVENTIHKEINSIVLDSVKNNNYGLFPLKTVHDNEWNLNLSNRFFINAVTNLKNKYYNVNIKTSNFPYYRYLRVELSPNNSNVYISFFYSSKQHVLNILDVTK